MRYSLSEIIARLGGELVGADFEADGVQTLAAAQSDQIAFLANPKYRQQLNDTQAGAVIVKSGSEGLPEHKSYIFSDDPYLYFARVAQLFHPRPRADGSCHQSAVIHHTAHIPASCEIGAHVVIGKNVRLGEGCRILAGSVIEADCILGDECVLHPNVVLYHEVRLGHRVEIHAGSVIGADGFGIARDGRDNTWCKIPQSGSVVIGDDVEIGANSNIDRGALGNTEIGEGAKIDNQVQIGHNCVIGKHTAIAACTGISGSTKIGNYCIVGGAAMFVGHIEIADHTLIGGGTAVTRSIPEAGHYATCFPLQTHKEWVRNAVHIRHLSDLNKRLKALEDTLSPS